MATAHSAAAQPHHQAAQAHLAPVPQAVHPQAVTAPDAEKAAAGNGAAILPATGQTIAHAHGMKLIVTPTELANAVQLIAAQVLVQTTVQATTQAQTLLLPQ